MGSPISIQKKSSLVNEKGSLISRKLLQKDSSISNGDSSIGKWTIGKIGSSIST